MDIVLIPGLWLNASSWDKVTPSLSQAGHRTHPLTLPGMESTDADRSKITLRNHVDAVVEVIDSLDAPGRRQDQLVVANAVAMVDLPVAGSPPNHNKHGHVAILRGHSG